MSGNGARVLNHAVINTFKQGTGTATGINFNGATGSFAVNNRITSADRGIDYSAGATGKYRDNEGSTWVVVTVATAKAGVSEKQLENYLKYANTDFSSALLFRF